MKDDATLLADYVAHGAESSFEQLVSRHAALVYSSALRQVGRPQLAEEVTQAVFCVLARKAKVLGKGTIISGWLYRTARFTALKALRPERRRTERELEFHRMDTDSNPKSDADAVWQQISPHLDEAMASLGDRDRDTLVLRFFEDRNLREVGERLDVSEDAAQKRASRALDRLRHYFSARKIGFSAGVIASVLPVNVISASPAASAASMTCVACSNGTAMTAEIVLDLTNETISMIAWTKLKTAIPFAAIGAIAIGTPIVIQQNTINDLRRQNAELMARNQQTAKRAPVTVKSDTVELDQLRADAAEVHKLRGEINRMKQERENAQTAAASANREKARLTRQLENMSTRAAESEAATVQERERTMFRQKADAMKTMGLKFHNAIASGRTPRTIQDFAKMGGLTDEQALELRRNFLFFDHSRTDPNVEGLRVVIAERNPTQTSTGENVWSYTTADGAAMLLKYPPPADGILREFKAGDRFKVPGSIRKQ